MPGPKKKYVNFQKECACGCGTMIWNRDRDNRIRRYVIGHHNRVIKHVGEKHYNWKGGRALSNHGYVLLKLPEHPKARKTNNL